jgi:hypothetical protein
MRKAFLMLFLLFAARAGAQAVEKPESFDSAGKVTVLTPIMAAKLSLSPPAWRITGDYTGARLFSIGDQGFVIVVERRDGALERYAITREDREYLRAKTSTMPVGLNEQLGVQLDKVNTGLTGVRQEIVRAAINDEFVLHQGLLAVLVYGPSFAYALSDKTPGRVAAYILGAGGTFYTATQIARSQTISHPENLLATHAALHGAGVGLGLAHALGGNANVKGAIAFAGGIGGTAFALWTGPGVKESDVAGAAFGSDGALLVTYLLLHAGHDPDKDFPTKSEAGLLATSVLVGYPLGLAYSRNAKYNVTAGDVGVLLTTGMVGGLAAGTVAHAMTRTSTSDRHRNAVYTSAAGGIILGAAAGDVALVRRFDHSGNEAAMLAFGASAGALMGAGAFTLIKPHRRNDEVAPYIIATAGAVAGIAVAEAFMPPSNDAGRQARANVHVNPLGLALAAARTPGQHSIVEITF